MDARLALVPRGATTETHRFFQALKFGCIVVTDSVPPSWFYEQAPIIRLRHWDELEENVTPLLADPGALGEPASSGAAVVGDDVFGGGRRPPHGPDDQRTGLNGARSDQASRRARPDGRGPGLAGCPPVRRSVRVRSLALAAAALARPGEVATLDAGTGNGAFAMYAASQGNEVVAVSDFPASLAKGERRARTMGLDRIRFRLIDLRELDRHAAELGSYDQSFCLEVIEHIVDDRKLLRDLAGVIRPGGRLLITTPYLHHVPYHDERVSTTRTAGTSAPATPTKSSSSCSPTRGSA